MLELGTTAGELHAGLVEPLKAAEVDLVFVSGPLMSRLWSVLPDNMRGAYGQTSADIAPLVAAEARPGDTVMVKGSFGSRMGLVVEALKARGQA
jgi:UDP-N-acetylmuramoyl-tripeptide--D-alanyl-D-alanine ligase